MSATCRIWQFCVRAILLRSLHSLAMTQQCNALHTIKAFKVIKEKREAWGMEGLVECRGFEPLTSTLPALRSPN